MAPGESATVVTTFEAIWNNAGQVATNTATAPPATDQYGDHTTTQTANASVKVTNPALTLTKTRVTDGAIQTSETVTFDLTVTNSGDTTLTTRAADRHVGRGLPALQLLPAGHGRGLRLRVMGRGADRTGRLGTVSLTLVALQPVPGLTTIDTATVVGAFDENGDPANDDIATDSVDITKPGVAVNKVLHAGQDPQVRVGDTVTFDIGVTNTGDTTLTTVPLADTYDSAVFSFATASTRS